MNEQRKNYNKWWYWGVGVVILIALIVGGVVIWRNNTNNEKTEEVNTSKVEEKEKSETEKVEPATSDASVADKAIEEKKVSQYEGEDPNKAEELTGVITYAGVSGDKLMIRVNIDQFLDNGECELGLRQAGMNVYNTSARIVSSASTATCEGFDVPLSSVGAGSTHIIITIKAGERVGTIEGEATI